MAHCNMVYYLGRAPSLSGRGTRLLYDAYELQRSWLNSASNWAEIGAELLSNPALPMGYFGTGPIMARALQVFAHLYAERGKPAFNIEHVEIRESIKPLLDGLGEREKRILLLRFFKNMTQSQIAEEIGVSQMHVSRLLTRTLAQLRASLESD